LEEFNLIIGQDKVHAAAVNWAKDLTVIIGYLKETSSDIPDWLIQIKALNYIEEQTAPLAGENVSHIITVLKVRHVRINRPTICFHGRVAYPVSSFVLLIFAMLF
jgi:hypothetical protein